MFLTILVSSGGSRTLPKKCYSVRSRIAFINKSFDVEQLDQFYLSLQKTCFYILNNSPELIIRCFIIGSGSVKKFYPKKFQSEFSVHDAVMFMILKSKSLLDELHEKLVGLARVKFKHSSTCLSASFSPVNSQVYE